MYQKKYIKIQYFRYFRPLPVMDSMDISTMSVWEADFSTYFRPASIKSGEYFSISFSNGSFFSFSAKIRALPKRIALSYLVLNFAGRSSVFPTTVKQTFALFPIFSSLRPVFFAQWK